MCMLSKEWRKINLEQPDLILSLSFSLIRKETYADRCFNTVPMIGSSHSAPPEEKKRIDEEDEEEDM